MIYYFSFCIVTAAVITFYGYIPACSKSVYFSANRSALEKIIFWVTTISLSLILAPIVAWSILCLSQREIIEAIVKGMDKSDIPN